MLHDTFHLDIMASKATLTPLDFIILAIVVLILPAYISGTEPIYSFIAEKLRVGHSGLLNILFGAASFAFVKRAFRIFSNNGEHQTVYGLQHGRLHLRVQTAMWMNMGYWKNSGASGTMAEACRDLLNVVLSEAWFSENVVNPLMMEDRQQTKCVVDLGFGCGDQTIYLMSATPVRACDGSWWDERKFCAKIEQYVGITEDPLQARFASERVHELIGNLRVGGKKEGLDIALFCSDAAKPALWNDHLQAAIRRAEDTSRERWVLALDTAYHFNPSRWPIVKYLNFRIHASFMAFDLCLSDPVTLPQKLMLRLLTTLMGAPWANFVTPQEYRARLVEAGYQDDMITIKDISEFVFSPLAEYLERQDTRLQTLGLGLGNLSIAKTMFRWWGRSGVVRGVIVVARQKKSVDE